jgi:hypothetical protein
MTRFTFPEKKSFRRSVNKTVQSCRILSLATRKSGKFAPAESLSQMNEQYKLFRIPIILQATPLTVFTNVSLRAHRSVFAAEELGSGVK